MKYEFDDYVQNATCVSLNSNDVLYAYQDNHNRRQYIRTGSKFLHNATNYSSYGYDLSNLVCVDIDDIEYEYSFVSPFFHFTSGIVCGVAFYLAFKLIIGRLFKGGSKW